MEKGVYVLMRKVAVFFTNDEGKYYIENTASFIGNEIPSTSYKHNPVMVIDESTEWRNYEKTKAELSHPTTKDGDVLVVIKELEWCC